MSILPSCFVRNWLLHSAMVPYLEIHFSVNFFIKHVAIGLDFSSSIGLDFSSSKRFKFSAGMTKELFFYASILIIEPEYVYVFGPTLPDGYVSKEWLSGS